MIYIVIPEPFSATEGVALAKIASDFMRYESKTIVVCPAADKSWGYPNSRILVCPLLDRLRRLRGWRFVPMWIRHILLSNAFKPLLCRLTPNDVVWFTNWWEMAEPIREEIRRISAKFIYHVHNSHKGITSAGLFHRLDPDAIVFLSDAMRHEVETEILSSTPVYTIYNGSEASRFWPSETPPSNDPPVVLFVGRLVPYKGVHVLLNAIKILRNRNIPVHCRIVGSAGAESANSKPTPYVASLHSTAPSNVRFVGFRSGTQIAEEYRGSDILCCPSTFAEPSGLVNIEAMACGLPVVASRTGGIPEIASDGGILLFERGNEVYLADKLQVLLLDRDLRLNVGAQGLASFKRRFTAEIAARHYMEVVGSVIANSGPSTSQKPTLGT